MLVSLNALVGLPVIWQDRRLGYVERAVADVRASRLEGLVVRKGIGAARWIGRDAIRLLGSSCVLAFRRPSRMPDEQPREARRVLLTTGQCAGEVTDALINRRTLKIAALEVCQGQLRRLLGQRGYAVHFSVNGCGREQEIITAQLLSRMQLKMQLEEGKNG